MQNPDINIIIPLFNEEKVFSELIHRIRGVLDQTTKSTNVILVDDGSKDGTAQLMTQLSLNDKRFVSVFLSRNFGHQLALSAGMSQVDAKHAVFILDGDLQDPPELLDDFFTYIEQGYDVVYAVREKRKEHFLKRMAYAAFYRFLKRISYIDFPLDSGDFSMLSRRVVDVMNSMPEQSRFLRGMRSWIGFNQIGVTYERSSREHGETKYSLKKLLALALNGIFNFSEYPIKFVSNLGVFATLSSLIYFIVTLIKRYYFHDVPQGFTATILLIIFFGGVNLIAIGIIGEYILRIFFQVKQRPPFIISHTINKTSDE